MYAKSQWSLKWCSPLHTGSQAPRTAAVTSKLPREPTSFATCAEQTFERKRWTSRGVVFQEVSLYSGGVWCGQGTALKPVCPCSGLCLFECRFVGAAATAAARVLLGAVVPRGPVIQRAPALS